VFIRPIITIAMMIGCIGLVCTLLFLVFLYGTAESFATILNDSGRSLPHGKVSRKYLGLVASYMSSICHNTSHQIETTLLHIDASLPISRKSRNKRRRQIPFRYLGSLAATYTVITAHYPAEARNGRRHHLRPPAETNGRVDQYDATVTCSSIAPPSDTAPGWHSPWTTSSDANHDVNQCRNPYRTAVSEGDCPAQSAHNSRREIKASEGGTNCHVKNCSFWNPLSFLSPQAEQRNPTTMCLITSHSHRPSASTQFDTDSAPVGIDNRCSVCMSHLKSDNIGGDRFFMALSNCRYSRGPCFGTSRTTQGSYTRSRYQLVSCTKRQS
jgi:hypothetical protein